MSKRFETWYAIKDVEGMYVYIEIGTDKLSKTKKPMSWWTTKKALKEVMKRLPKVSYNIEVTYHYDNS